MTVDRKTKYESKREKLSVSFNTETEMELLKYAKSIVFSDFVKQEIKNKLDQGGKSESKIHKPIK